MHMYNCICNLQCKIKLFRSKYYLLMANAPKYSLWLIFEKLQGFKYVLLQETRRLQHELKMCLSCKPWDN